MHPVVFDVGNTEMTKLPPNFVELKERYDAGGFYDVIPEKRLQGL